MDEKQPDPNLARRVIERVEFILANLQNPEAITTFRKQRTAKLINEIAQLSTFWQEYLTPIQQQDSRRPLERLPIMTKDFVRANSDLMHVWIPKSNESQYGIASSSGSTGKPISVTKFNPDVVLDMLSCQMLIYKFHEVDITQPLGYFKFTGKNLDQQSWGPPANFLGKTGPSFSRGSKLQSNDELLDLIQEKKIGVGFGSGMLWQILAKHKLLNEKWQDVRLQHIISQSDRIDSGLRKLLQEAFGAEVIDIYSSEEFGFIALQCKAGNHLHVMDFFNHVEIVDGNGQPVAEGIPGRVLVTNLANRAMPLIRYELGDIAKWSDKCELMPALPTLEPVIVRTRESFVNESGNLSYVYVESENFASIKNISDYQIYTFDDAVLLAHSGNDLTESEKNRLSEYLTSVFGQEKEVRFFKTDLPWLSHWKRKMYVVVQGEMPTELSDQFLRDEN